jgi:hypothetical protein
MQYASTVSSQDTSSYESGDDVTESSLSDGEERMAANDVWQGQAQAWIRGKAAPDAVSNRVGSELAPELTPELAPDSHNYGIGIRTSTWQTEKTRQTHVVMLDSLDRDQKVYPLPTSLRLKLPRVYKNIERIDIVQLKFLNSIFTFSDARANTGFVWFDASGVQHVFDISEGTYTLADLQTAFTTGGFTLSVGAQTGRVTLVRSNGAAFSIPWACEAPVSTGQTHWGLGWNLGFPKKNLTCGTSFTGQVWPRLFDDYAFLQLNLTEQMNDVDHTSPTFQQAGIWQDSTGQVQHYFGKLLLNNFGCWSQAMVEAPKVFRPPLSRLERINVNWLDSTGQPIGGGAAGCDWHMTLRIIEYVEAPTTGASLVLSSGVGMDDA